MPLAAHFLDDLQRRDMACALAMYAVNGDAGRHVGDPIHEQVTEGRRKQWEDARKAGAAWALKMTSGYHSCGDLVAWVLTRLGCRDEALVNRTDDGGIRAWQPGRNVSNITGSRHYRRAKDGGTPQPGDALFILKNGGHLAILLGWDAEGRTVTTADYGQPYGRKRVRQLGGSAGRWTLDGSVLDGWLDLDAVEFTAAPDLTMEDA
jgi:hypothetical protein